MSLLLCKAGCGADVSRIPGAFCGPCRASLGLAPLPEPVKARIWTEAEIKGFREREARRQDLAWKIALLPDRPFNEDDDPFIGVEGGDLSIGLANGGGKR